MIIKKCVAMLGMIVSFATYSASIELDEHMSLYIEVYDQAQEAEYAIDMPGYSSWVEKGRLQVSSKMPACLIVLSNTLEDEVLKKFLEELEVLTVKDKQLTLEHYKGTWLFVDKSPVNHPFNNLTRYKIQTKSHRGFGDLLASAGAEVGDRVSIEFNRGCVAVASRAYFPEGVTT